MTRRRLVSRLMLGGVAAVAIFAAWMASRIYRMERSGLVSLSAGSLAVPLARADLAGVSEVTIPTRAGFSVSAWYAPPENGVLVIVAHGSGGDRSEMIPFLRLLRESHIGLLAFDWPGRGLSGGAIEYNASELAALHSVADWAAGRPGLGPHGLGALGFSYGGFMIARLGAADTRIRRVALLGVYPSGWELARYQYRAWGTLAAWTAVRADLALGMEPDSVNAVDLVGAISPRPLLIIAGTLDSTVPLEFSRAVFERAREPKEFLAVEGARHGEYMTVAPTVVGPRLVRFFAGH